MVVTDGSVVVVVVGGTVVVVVVGGTVVVVVVGGTVVVVVVVVGGTVVVVGGGPVVVVVVVVGGGRVVGTVGRVVVVTTGGTGFDGGAVGNVAAIGLSSVESDDDKGRAESMGPGELWACFAALARLAAAFALPANCLALGV